MAKPTSSTVRDARKPGWFYVENDVIDHYGADVGAIGVAVYVALARFANRDGQAFPAYKTLATNLGIARNTVITAIRKLEESGLITIEPQTDDAGNPIATNVYTLCAIADQKGQWRRKGGAGVEQGGAAYEPPHATVEQGGAANGRGGATAAYEHDSSNMIDLIDDRDRRTFEFLENEGIGAAKEFARLPYEPMRLDYQNRIAAGQSIATIVKAWRRNPPTKDYHYARPERPLQPDASPNRPGRSAAKGKHNPTGGAELRDPGWMDREIARAEARARGEL